MKIKINELLDIKIPLSKLVNQDIPVLASYDLMKIVKVFDEELDIFTKAKKKLYEKYGTENKEKTKTTVLKEKVKAFKKDLEALLNKIVELNIEKIKISSLGDSIKMKPVELLTMNLIITK